MKILQFAFDGKKSNPYLPKNHIPNSVTYIGTHDNQTLKGFTDNLTEENKTYIGSVSYEDVGLILELRHYPNLYNKLLLLTLIWF